MKKILLTAATVAISLLSNAQSLSDSLLMYFPFSGNANDYSGNSFNGTTMGGIALTTDREGNPNSAYMFDGVDDYINIPHNSGYKKPLPLTISTWLYLDDSSLVQQIFKNDNHPTVYAGANANVVNSNYSTSFSNTLGAGSQFRETVASGVSARSGQWHHYVTVIHEADSMEIYIDGVRDTTASYSGTGDYMAYTSSDACIGFSYNPFGGDQYYSGKIDEVAYWNRALTANEVEQLYQLPANTVLAISMDGNANDISLYGNHGTENGGIALTKDRFGNDNMAYRFDGTDDFLEIASDASFHVSFPFTYSNWVKIDTFATLPIMFTNDQPTNYAGGWVNFVDGKASAGVGNNGGAGSQFRKSTWSTDSVTAGSWNQIVCVFNSINDIQLYVNGELDNTTTLTGTAATLVYNNLPALLGKSSNPFGADLFFIGDMDESLIFSKALSATDVMNYFIPGVYFDQHPGNDSKVEGTGHTFTSHAIGTGNQLHYQWQKDNAGSWTDLAGDTNATLTITTLAMADAGTYRCKATSYNAVSYSDEAVLTVTEPVDGIAEVADAVRTYPNPAHDVVVVEVANHKGFYYTMYDMVGSVVLTGQGIASSTTIQVGDLQSGIYLLEVQQEGQRVVKRLIIK